MAVESCRSDIKAHHREDQYAREILDDVVAKRGGKPASSALTPNGPGLADAKRQWHATEGGVRVADKLIKAMNEKARQAVLEGNPDKAVQRGGVAPADACGAARSQPKGDGVSIRGLRGLNLVLWIKTGVEVATELHKGAGDDGKQQAQRETDGLNRDAMRLFIVGNSGSVFSPAYRSFLTRDVSGASKKVASDMVTIATAKRGASYDAEATVIRAMAKQGAEAAKTKGIATGEALEKAFATDPEFKKLFESSTAFRLGVGAYVYEHSRHRPSASTKG